MTWQVLPPGEAGAERGDPATGSYSLKIEGDVLGSYVFWQRKVGEERGDADPQSSSREKNESELEVFWTEDSVTEGKDLDQQNFPSVVTLDSVSDSSVWKFRTNSILLSPGTDFEPQETGLIPKLSRFFQGRKSSQGTREKKRTSPEILQTAQFSETLAVAPGKLDKQVRQRRKTNWRRPSMSLVDESRHSNRYRGDQSSVDSSLYRLDTATSTTDNTDEQTSDDEHGGCCCMCYFKAPRSRRARCRL
ncbi:hypothetical protein EV401DRAFT_753054 [Pisolithus croceorrhizus]|nr:hypothetical protein EV401DRAFT_753054 [Pisolithus croceorrhizus]